MAVLVGGNLMDDSAEFQLNYSAEGIAQEGTAVLLDKTEETISFYILDRYGFL